jgi:SH3-like domain-containing protein
MGDSRSIMRRVGSITMAVSCLAIALATAYALFSKRNSGVATAEPASAEVTASLGRPDVVVGASGLPLPRFVSLKAEKVNVRRGPASEHQVAWVFQRRGLPVEIVAEFENWRRIRDNDGEEGWVYKSMLAGKRTALVAPWRKGDEIPMYSAAGLEGGLIAKVDSGVVAEIESCSGTWCEISAGGYEGWMEQTMLWGVYPNETIGD